jgi:hypothetical protein
MNDKKNFTTRKSINEYLDSKQQEEFDNILKIPISKKLFILIEDEIDSMIVKELDDLKLRDLKHIFWTIHSELSERDIAEYIYFFNAFNCGNNKEYHIFYNLETKKLGIFFKKNDKKITDAIIELAKFKQINFMFILISKEIELLLYKTGKRSSNRLVFSIYENDIIDIIIDCKKMLIKQTDRYKQIFKARMDILLNTITPISSKKVRFIKKIDEQEKKIKIFLYEQTKKKKYKKYVEA